MSGPPGHSPQPLPEPTIRLTEGWHCLHVYYRVDPARLNKLDAAERAAGCEEVAQILNSQREGAPERMQVSVTSGHRADLGLMLLDADPLKIDGVHQAIRASRLGTVLQPTYSFVSITEVSEYVPTVEQYAEKLRLDGVSPEDPSYIAKLKGYEQRLPLMNKQRLYPDFPIGFPVTCFYPMNKIRDPAANWFLEPFSRRSALMAEHATSGIKFAGKLTQFITASTGFDDWEWGVTLWARNRSSSRRSCTRCGSTRRRHGTRSSGSSMSAISCRRPRRCCTCESHDAAQPETRFL